MARIIARSAAAIESALEAEVWASQLLGTFLRSRYELPFPEGVGIDPALEYGEPLLREFGRIDGPGAAIATLAIAELEDGELGMQAQELLDNADMWARLPAWAADIGESEIVRAAVIRDPIFDDAQNVFLESRHADGQVFAVGVLIDNNLSRMAKDVLLVDSIDAVDEALRARTADDGGQLVLEHVAPGVAAGLIRDAIASTDITWDPPVEEAYWSGRALALLRSDQTSHVVTPKEPDELPEAEREALHTEFLSSPEGSGFAADGDEAWVALLAIDFAAGYLGSDPLRWSPSVVELFMLDWVPRKVITSPAMLHVLPEALDAWVRFAGRKRELPGRAIAVTLEAIGEFTAEMIERAADPDVAGPSKQFMLAAQEAGVDVEDAAALETFIAGWNARSGLDEAGFALAGGEDADDDGAAMADLERGILQIKVVLRGVAKPPVWRRLQVPAGTPLDELHEIIQAAFGWEDCHLHMFDSGDEYFGPADPEDELGLADERQATLADLVTGSSDRITYIYDFGDNWRHDIRPEKLLEPVDGVDYPVLVVAKGACPPEDCGGVSGYEELKAVLADPGDDEHEELRGWLGLSDGEVFDPAAVDVEAIRARLAGRAR